MHLYWLNAVWAVSFNVEKKEQIDGWPLIFFPYPHGEWVVQTHVFFLTHTVYKIYKAYRHKIKLFVPSYPSFNHLMRDYMIVGPWQSSKMLVLYEILNPDHAMNTFCIHRVQGIFFKSIGNWNFITVAATYLIRDFNFWQADILWKTRVLLLLRLQLLNVSE